jgi:cytolysin (calcineurin-like family phosphatase)
VPFLQNDLAQHASDGRPVFVFHHYGLDPFGLEERWWTNEQRSVYRQTLEGYNVAGIVAGHTHYAQNYDWEGLHVFQTNNAKAEINSGNRDGNGSFTIMRVTPGHLDTVTCRWLDDAGRFELIAPHYGQALDTSAIE